jgi:ABC-type branched-subunit amino acid transport system ATPase component
MITVGCKGLQKSFGGTCALADVSLQFPPAAVTAIIGPNGAGKTTLLNVITGFVRPDQGQCFVKGTDTTGWSPQRIAREGICRSFQDLRVISRLSVVEHVMLARPHTLGDTLFRALTRLGVSADAARQREESMRLLATVGLENRATASAAGISYGEQKLLTLACCLSTEAQLLFLDEPVSGVHPLFIDRILKILYDIRKAGKTVVFIEHDIESVRQVADRVIVMDEGRVVADGPPHDVLARGEIMRVYLG